MPPAAFTERIFFEIPELDRLIADAQQSAASRSRVAPSRSPSNVCRD